MTSSVSLKASNIKTAQASGESDAAFVNNAALVAMLLLAAFVRFYALDASSLWNDEGTTWALLGRSFPQIARDAAADIHPPGYYWLLKVWTAAPGRSAWAMRSMSAVSGVLLVYVVYRIGGHLTRADRTLRTTALLAALIAALNPFQVYYGQEARMYMLLSLLSAGLFWALFALVRREDGGAGTRAPLVWYVICGAAGLWVHYSFPIVLGAAFLAYILHFVRTGADARSARAMRLLRFGIANLAAVALFLPWLPTAVDRVVNWPKGGEWVSWLDGLTVTIHTLVFGPIRSSPEVSVAWLLVAAALPLLGVWALRSDFGGPALGLWWLAPILLMATLGLYSDAFLKFLLVASPAWCLLVAAAPLCCRRPQPIAQAALAVTAVAVAAVTLPGYYADPAARDNYAGVARYLQAVGDPSQDTVVINAPGQQDVWEYYDPGLPMLAVPEQRPPNATQTVGRLESALADQQHAYALLWATDESDPDRIVESWLAQKAFKGMESWQGNLRFVVYSLVSNLECREFASPISYGADISLLAQCQPEHPQRVVAGDAATIALHWRADSAVSESYKVSVQLLDARNQVVAQHDGIPAGGSRPTPAWQVAETVVDNHGLAIPPGTPPGFYRLVVVVYEAETGERLLTDQLDHLDLAEVEVVRPLYPLPADVIPIGHRASRQLGPVRLVGYAAHAKGFSHAPDTPLWPGDLVHVSLLWQAPDPLPQDWPADLTFALRLGEQAITAPLAGGGHPTGAWQTGEIVRGEFDIAYDGSDRTPVLSVGTERYQLERLPVE